MGMFLAYTGPKAWGGLKSHSLAQSHEEGQPPQEQIRGLKHTGAAFPCSAPGWLTNSQIPRCKYLSCLGLGVRWGKLWNFPRWWLLNGKHCQAPCSCAQVWRGRKSQTSYRTREEPAALHFGKWPLFSLSLCVCWFPGKGNEVIIHYSLVAP